MCILSPLQSYELLSQIIKSLDDDNSYGWQVASSPNASLCYQSSFNIYDNHRSSNITIIDCYYGKTPFLVDKQFCQDKTAKVNFLPTLLLDSNIASNIGNLMNYFSHEQLHKNHGLYKNLLIHIEQKQFDICPYFYYLEAYSKNALEKFYPTVLPIAKGIITFQACDPQKMLYEERLVFSEKIMECYFKDYGTYDFLKVAQNHLESERIKGMLSEINTLLELTYVILLKMVLIHKCYQGTIFNKTKHLYEFLLEKVGLICSYELYLGIYYFAGLADKFINVQTNMQYMDAVKTLKRTAWDVLLLRFPSIMLEREPDNVTNLAYPCTAEKKLQEFGSLLTMDLLINYTKKGRIFAVSGFCFNDLNLKKLQKMQLDETISWINNAIIRRMFQRMDMPSLLYPSNIKIIITDLEGELKKLCR